MVKPRISLVPDSTSSLGAKAVRLASSAGLNLDDWQRYVLRSSLGLKDGKWAAFEVGVNVSRQNGKGGILEARELAGLFLQPDQYLIHSAHAIDTSLEHFYRLEGLILDTPALASQVRKISRTNGQEAIWLKNGSRIRFRTRTKGGGRGFSCDLLVLDEAMFLPEFAHGALLPTLSARPNPQVWYTGSAVDQHIHENGVVFSRVRQRGITGDEGLAYFEWSVDKDNPDLVEGEASDRKAWRRANPAMGIRIDPTYIDHERRSLDPRSFAVERLGVGDWPPTTTQSLVDLDAWVRLADLESQPEGRVVVGFDVRPDRSAGSVCIAGVREDGRVHLELVERRRGTHWIVPLLKEMAADVVVCDAVGPAGSLVVLAEENGLEVTPVSARELVDACGLFFDAVAEGTIRHLGQPELLGALRGAARRPLGDSWAWSRKNSAVDISPLVACTLALWASQTARPSEVFALSW